MADSNQLRQRRKRFHATGNHLLCSPARCAAAAASGRVDRHPPVQDLRSWESSLWRGRDLAFELAVEFRIPWALERLEREREHD